MAVYIDPNYERGSDGACGCLVLIGILLLGILIGSH